MVTILPTETVDDLLIKGLRIIQKSKGFRFTLDSVLLAHFATIKRRDRVVDLGTGTGIIPLLMTTRADDLKIIGIEIQKDIADMANRSVGLNKLEDQIKVINSDIKDIKSVIKDFHPTSIIANPPYWSIDEGKISHNEGRALSRHEISSDFKMFVATASKLLNNQGRFTCIHRSERFLEILQVLNEQQLTPRRIRFVHPFKDKKAGHVMIEARKKAVAHIEVLPPLIVYKEQGKYSQEVLKWYDREAK